MSARLHWQFNVQMPDILLCCSSYVLSFHIVIVFADWEISDIVTGYSVLNRFFSWPVCFLYHVYVVVSHTSDIFSCLYFKPFYKSILSPKLLVSRTLVKEIHYCFAFFLMWRHNIIPRSLHYLQHSFSLHFCFLIFSALGKTSVL